MNDIRSILKLATRRLETASVLRCLNIVVVVVGGLVIVMLVVERAGATLFWPWIWLGPLFAGILSDYLSMSLGNESLRYSLLIIGAVLTPWTALHYFMASKHIEQDLARVSEPG